MAGMNLQRKVVWTVGIVGVQPYLFTHSSEDSEASEALISAAIEAPECISVPFLLPSHEVVDKSVVLLPARYGTHTEQVVYDIQPTLSAFLF
jgi:hypothetical protein